MQYISRAAILKVAALFSLFVSFALILPGSPLIAPCFPADIMEMEALIWPLQGGGTGRPLDQWLSLPDSIPGFLQAGWAYYPLYRRYPSSEEEALADFSFPFISASWSLSKGEWRGGIVFTRDEKSLTLRLPIVPPHESRFDAGQGGTQVSGFVMRKLPLRWKSNVAVGAGVGSVTSVGNPAWAGMALSPTPQWNVLFEHLWDYQYLHIDYYYENETLSLPLSVHTVGERAYLSGSVFSKASFTAELATHALYSPWDDFSVQSNAFVPQGVYRTQNYRLDLNLSNCNTLWLYHRQDYLNSEGNFYNEGLKFGKMTRGDLFVSLFDLGFKRPAFKGATLLMVYRWLTVQGYLKGHLEFWPFTPTFVDLLGLRRYYEGELEAEIHGLNVLLESHRLGPFKAAYGLGTWYVEPQAELSSWQPQFLVFGKTDERNTAMKVEDAWIGGVSFGLTYEQSNWRVSFQVRQLFPIRVNYLEEPALPAPPGEAEPEVWTYGGGFFNLSMACFFQ